MDERLCEANRRPIIERMEVLSKAVEKLSLDMAQMKLDVAGQAKDTLHLQQAISTLQTSIDTLVEVIDGLKYKPVKNYEKAMWIVITAVIMYTLGRAGLK